MPVKIHIEFISLRIFEPLISLFYFANISEKKSCMKKEKPFTFVNLLSVFFVFFFFCIKILYVPNIIYHFVESLLSTHAWSLHKRCLGRLTTKQNIDNTHIRTYQWNASLFYEIYISDSYKLKPVNRIKQNVAKLTNKITLSESESPSWFLLNEFATNMYFQLLAYYLSILVRHTYSLSYTRLHNAHKLLHSHSHKQIKWDNRLI